MTLASKNLPLDSSRRRRSSDLPRLAALGIVYFLAVKLSYLFPDSANVMAVIWPASGISLAALLLSPRDKWPTVLAVVGAADFVAKLTIGKSVLISAGFMIANLAEAAGRAFAGTHRSRRAGLIPRWHPFSLTRMTSIPTTKTDMLLAFLGHSETGISREHISG